MPDERSAEQKALRAALGAGNDCPGIEELESLLGDTAQVRPNVAQHVEICAHCRTELALLREFQSGTVRESEAEAVRLITERLNVRSSPIISVPGRTEAREPWWRVFWKVRWLSPAALAAAAVLIFLAVGIQWRQSAPALHAPGSPDQDVMRSNALVALSPNGDVAQVPTELRWQPAPAAVKYQVRLMEVDHSELWSANTAADHIDLPAQVRTQIVPRKTLLWEVSGLDASGRVVAESSSIRFRFLQNLYTR